MNLRHTAWLALLLGGMGWSALAGPALADARDDVLSASQRCAGIADDRTWLDCYYGSAQPMRSRLGLPAAPAGQIRLVPPAMGAPAQPAYNAPAYAPQPAYGPQPAYAPQPTYGIPANGAPVLAAPRVASVPAGPPPMQRRRSGGFFFGLFGSGKAAVANLRMSSYVTDHNGKFTVTLSDGEVWAQDSGDSSQASWRSPASRYVVNVYEGALGTYNMEVSDDSSLYKVHRVK